MKSANVTANVIANVTAKQYRKIYHNEKAFLKTLKEKVTESRLPNHVVKS